jgi:hypothetical protein
MASQYTVRAERARQQALPISAPRGASNAPPGRAATHMQGLKSLSFCPLPAHACLLAPARGGLGWQWRAVQGAACERDAPTARAIFSAVSCTLAPPITPNPCSNPCTPPAHPQHCPPPRCAGSDGPPGPCAGRGQGTAPSLGLVPSHPPAPLPPGTLPVQMRCGEQAAPCQAPRMSWLNLARAQPARGRIAGRWCSPHSPPQPGLLARRLNHRPSGRRRCSSQAAPSRPHPAASLRRGDAAGAC